MLQEENSVIDLENYMTPEEREAWIPQPGDEVVIREWDDMREEFGLDLYRDISCDIRFTKEMKKFCGNHYIIEKVHHSRVLRLMFTEFNDGINSYFISKDMVSLVTQDNSFDGSSVMEFLDSIHTE